MPQGGSFLLYDGDKSGEDFWVKAEKLYYTALIGYIWYEAPEHEKNFTTLLELINASEAREDDETFKNPVDLMFDELEERDPDHFAVKQYRKYKLAAGDTRKNIPFHISTDIFGQKLGTCSEKFFLPLYNGHSFRRLAGRARVIFWNRIPLLLYNGQYFVDWGDLSKILFTLQRTFSPRKTGVRLKKVKIKMLPALGKAEASYSVDMRF